MDTRRLLSMPDLYDVIRKKSPTVYVKVLADSTRERALDWVGRKTTPNIFYKMSPYRLELSDPDWVLYTARIISEKGDKGIPGFFRTIP